MMIEQLMLFILGAFLWIALAVAGDWFRVFKNKCRHKFGTWSEPAEDKYGWVVQTRTCEHCNFVESRRV